MIVITSLPAAEKVSSDSATEINANLRCSSSRRYGPIINGPWPVQSRLR